MFFRKKKKIREIQQVIAEPSYISQDTTLEGNLICDGEIHIDGAIRGSVKAHTCLIEKNGEVHGEVSAENIFIRGRVIGPVNGTHVHIYAGAHVEGNVINETLTIDNGAYLYGSIRHSGLQNKAGVNLTKAPVSLLTENNRNDPSLSVDEIDNVRPLKANTQRP